MDESKSNDAISLWLPFTKEEIGIGVGLLGVLLTILNFTKP